MPDLKPAQVESLRAVFPGPVILTLRSSEEGGAFAQDADTWMDTIMPFLSYVTMVDVEIRYRKFAQSLKEMGKTIIASCHSNEMLSSDALTALYQDLRRYGDIPKIAVHPRDTDDLLTLLTFTHTSGKPLIVSVTGGSCRYARPLLPLFGSLFTYCYIDNPTAKGQYSLREMRMIFQLINPGIIDTWFDGCRDMQDSVSASNSPDNMGLGRKERDTS